MNAPRLLIRAFLATACLVGGMLAGTHLAKGSNHAKPASKVSGATRIERQGNADKPPVGYYAFDTPFVINDPESELLVQLKVALSSNNASTLANIRYLDPAVRSSIIIALTDLGPEILSGKMSKGMLKNKIKSAINNALLVKYRKSKVNEIYLTEFLVVGLDA